MALDIPRPEPIITTPPPVSATFTDHDLRMLIMVLEEYLELGGLMDVMVPQWLARLK